MEEQEMEQNQLRVDVTPAQQLSSNEVNELLELLKAGYDERWISDENFRDVIIRNATELLKLYSGDKLAAALVFDNKRISDIAVHPDFQGKGLGVKLFEEAAKAHPDSWISVGIGAEAMLATITAPKLNFVPIEDRAKIEDLFRQTNRGRDNFKMEATKIAVPFLTERLADRGIAKDEFLAFVRPGATHGSSYQQILFQNQV